MSCFQVFEDYVSTYLERDVRQILNIQDLATFQRFIQLCAGRIGQLLNITSLAADTGITRVTAERVYDLPSARNRFARSMRLSMNGNASQAGAGAVGRLKKLLEPHRNGACPVEIQYSNGDAKVELRLGDDWRVKLDDALMTSLNEWLKPENVQVNYG